MGTLIVLLGPTGVGKTDLSIELAKMYGTSIISCDSRQIYKEMYIGTAVPEREQLEAVPHFFIQTESVRNYFNCWEFEQQALRKIRELFETKEVVIMAGGSMMYIDAVCKGIDEMPTIDEEVRLSVKEMFERDGIEALRMLLKRLDPVSYTTVDLKNECVDPRFKYVTRGCAEYVEWLGQKENPDGRGWATGSGYGAKIITILNAMIGIKSEAAESEEVWYRVRKTWTDAATQKGAFHSLENAKRCADENEGYSVFDESGKVIYSNDTFTPYLVRVSIDDLNIRKGSGTNYDKTGKYTGKSAFTIVEEAEGKGASLWGLLTSYQKNRNGWISLDYTERF